MIESIFFVQKLKWYRFCLIDWQPPAGAKLVEIEEGISDVGEVDHLVNSMIASAFVDNSISGKIGSMPRDQQNWMMDILNRGKQLLADKMKLHLQEKVAENPDYILSDATLKGILEEVSSTMGQTLQNGA